MGHPLILVMPAPKIGANEAVHWLGGLQVSDRDDDPLIVEGEPAKRIGVYSDVGDVGGFDTFEEAWKEYQNHRDKIMPILKKRKKGAEGRYWFRVNNKQMTVEDFRWAMEKERREKKAD